MDSRLRSPPDAVRSSWRPPFLPSADRHRSAPKDRCGADSIPNGVFTRGDSRRSVARPIAAIGRMYVYTVRLSQRPVARPVARLFTRCDRRGDQSARSSCGFNVNIYQLLAPPLVNPLHTVLPSCRLCNDLESLLSIFIPYHSPCSSVGMRPRTYTDA